MIRMVSIRKGRPGTWDTLKLIDGMAEAGSTSPYLTRFVLTVPLSQWNNLLKQHWSYVDEEEETLRSIPQQLANLMKYQRLIGDCDDAALVAAAIARASRIPYRIVAVRSPEQSEFSHVFIEVQSPGFKWLRIDPTAPEDANYEFWERLEYP